MGRQEALAAKETQKKGGSTLPFNQLCAPHHLVGPALRAWARHNCPTCCRWKMSCAQHEPSGATCRVCHPWPCLLRSWLSFYHVWYSVDLPQGQDPTPGPKTAEGEKEAEPRLFLLSVCPDSLLLAALAAAAALIHRHVLTEPAAYATHCAVLHRIHSAGPPWRCWLAQDVSGAFRPNVLTALVGETGAGKVRAEPPQALLSSGSGCCWGTS